MLLWLRSVIVPSNGMVVKGELWYIFQFFESMIASLCEEDLETYKSDMELDRFPMGSVNKLPRYT